MTRTDTCEEGIPSLWGGVRVSSLQWADVPEATEIDLSQEGTLTVAKVMREGKHALTASDLASPCSLLMD